MKLGANTLVHMLLSPTSVETEVDGHLVKGMLLIEVVGVLVNSTAHPVQCTTNYPFSDVLKYDISTERAFLFAIRVPEWTDIDSTSIKFGSKEWSSPLTRDSLGLHKIQIKPGQTTILINLPMEIRIVTRNDSVGVFRGPLLYAADIDYNTTYHQPLNWSDQTPLADSEVDRRSRDWVLQPTSGWKYAIDPGSVRVKSSGNASCDLSTPVFSRVNIPVSLEVDAYEINWPEAKGTAALPPLQPNISQLDKVVLKLIPFGAAKLHIAQFPIAAFN